jgi:hypothetical protein
VFVFSLKTIPRIVFLSKPRHKEVALLYEMLFTDGCKYFATSLFEFLSSHYQLRCYSGWPL